jgi:hypothetical protein
MSGLSLRLDRLERSGANAWRAWRALPVGQWPEAALLAHLAETQGWPRDHVPTDAELRSVTAWSGRRGTAR